jgi:hypothetical protein
MTEGIIQKTIEKTKRNARNTSFSDSVRVSMLLNELEQELIAEIKKEFNIYSVDWYLLQDLIKKKLIGDNNDL